MGDGDARKIFSVCWTRCRLRRERQAHPVVARLCLVMEIIREAHGVPDEACWNNVEHGQTNDSGWQLRGHAIGEAGAAVMAVHDKLRLSCHGGVDMVHEL